MTNLIYNFTAFFCRIYKSGNHVYDWNEAFFKARSIVMNKKSILNKKGEEILLLVIKEIYKVDSSLFWKNAAFVFSSRVERGYINFEDLGFNQGGIDQYRAGVVTEDFMMSLSAVSSVWKKAFWEGEEREDLDTVKLSTKLQPLVLAKLP